MGKKLFITGIVIFIFSTSAMARKISYIEKDINIKYEEYNKIFPLSTKYNKNIAKFKGDINNAERNVKNLEQRLLNAKKQLRVTHKLMLDYPEISIKKDRKRGVVLLSYCLNC